MRPVIAVYAKLRIVADEDGLDRCEVAQGAREDVSGQRARDVPERAQERRFVGRDDDVDVARRLARDNRRVLVDVHLLGGSVGPRLSLGCGRQQDLVTRDVELG